MPSVLAHRVIGFTGAVLLAAAVGCGAGGGKASVSGKVLAGGQPVTSGSITFMPINSEGGASPASGEIKPDGTFVMGTEKPADGVAVGKHSVSFSAPSVEQPEWDGYGTPPAAKEVPYANLVPKQTELEVQAGANDITVELVPAPAVLDGS